MGNPFEPSYRVSLRESPDTDSSPKTGFHHPYIVKEPSFSIAGVTNQAEVGQQYIDNFCTVCLFAILILSIRPRRSSGQLLVTMDGLRLSLPRTISALTADLAQMF
jgi:hypothetical protein